MEKGPSHGGSYEQPGHSPSDGGRYGTFLSAGVTATEKLLG